MTNQEKIIMARYIDPSGVLEAVLTELFKHPEKDWNTKKVKDKIKIVI